MFPKLIYDLLHLMPTLLVFVTITTMLYFILRRKRHEKVIACAIALFVGFVLYLDGDAF